MTRAQLLAEVRARLGESGTGFYSDAQINQWLVDGVDYIALAVEPLVGTTTINVTAVTGAAPWVGQGEYALGATIISIKQVYFLNAQGKYGLLEETTYEDLFNENADWESSKGDPPEKWYWVQDTIGIWPKPSVTRTAALKFLRTYRPTAMAVDSDTTGLPTWLDRAVVLYAIYRCRLKDRDEERAAISMAELTLAIRQAASKMQKPRKDHAPHIYPNQRAYRLYYGHSRYPYIRVATS